MVPRIVVGKGITGLTNYVLGEGKGAGNDNVPPGQESRVAWIGGQNFGFTIKGREDPHLIRPVQIDDPIAIELREW
jgi:hypothetical protein